MRNLSPVGKVYQAGTLSGNPVAVTAGLETIKILKSMDYKRLQKKTINLCNGIKQNAMEFSINVVINQIGSMFTVFFTDKREVYDYNTAWTSNTKYYAKFFHEMLKQGIYFPPSQFESCFVSFAHTEEDIKKTINASYIAFQKIKG